MFKLDLNIPIQVAVSADYEGLEDEVDAVQFWLNQRDSSCSHDLIEYLQQLNRRHCDTLQRIKIMQLLNPIIESFLQDYMEQNQSVSFPLNDEHRHLIEVMQLLLIEMANSYKSIVLSLTEESIWLTAHLDKCLPEAIYFSLLYLSRLMVERYQVYISDPLLTWKEINQLYLLAEQFGCHKTGIQGSDSIETKYLQIAILHILDPFRLMRFEARKIYNLMQEWSVYCSIKPMGRNNPGKAHVVDLLRDNAPFRIAEKPDVTLIEGRVIDIVLLYEHLKKQLVRFLIKSGQPLGDRYVDIEGQSQKNIQPLLAFSERLHYEMLERILLDLDFTGERTEERYFTGHEIKMVAEFEACHYFISGREAFNPQAEIRQQNHRYKHVKLSQGESQEGHQMSFVDLLEEEKRQLKKNPFGELNNLASDPVTKANVHYYNFNMKHTFNEENWLQRNESDKGMLLICKTEVNNPIAVGMLVAYRQPDNNAFFLAVVKWLRIIPQKGMAIGVRQITSKSHPIAVKGERGVGAGDQFIRAFIIHEGKENQTAQNLLLPAGVFNQGSVLQVWHKKKLSRVKILKILMSTDSFEQVQFKLVEDKTRI
jgi:hypothetical protein